MVLYPVCRSHNNPGNYFVALAAVGYVAAFSGGKYPETRPRSPHVAYSEENALELLSESFATLLKQGIEAARKSGALPEFETPEITVSKPSRPNQGDYATPIAMQLAKSAKANPRQIAQAIAEHIPPAPFLDKVEVAGPGFINFWLAPRWVQEQVETIISEGPDHLGEVDIGRGQKAQVEFVSANPTGPITVGRTRGAVMGDTLANMLEAAGYRVEREYYFNNAGRQMELLGRSLQARYLQLLGRDALVPEDGYHGDYLRWIAAALYAEHGDSLADRDWMYFKEKAEAAIFANIRHTLARLGVYFDVYFNEKSLYDDNSVWEAIEELKKRGYAYEAEGATWFKATEFGLPKDRVIVKSTGEPTYIMPDIAYHVNKLKRGFDLIVDIFGADHQDSYPNVLAGVRALGYDPSPIKVVIHQFVTLVEGGETRRMSTRKGEFVTLDELIDEVGADAVRYFVLARSPESHMEFDLELARKQTNENPVYYIQNAHVRCAGIFRQAKERGVTDDGADVHLLSDPRELALIRKMLELPDVLAHSVRRLEPHHIAFYALDLARMFHPTYEEVRALHSEVPPELQKARLRFYRAAKTVFARLLGLMGMSAPDFM